MTALPDIPTADLARVVAAVRAIDVGRAELLTTPTPNARVVGATRLGSTRLARAALLLLFVFPAIFMHSTRGRAWISSPTPVPSAEEFRMNRFQVMAVTGAAAGMTALSSVGVASAQDAVQWRVEDGGNGHWYRVVSPDYPSRDWYLVKAIAEADGGYLATITSVEENQFLALQPNFAPIDLNAESQFWLGGIRVGSQWTWVNGESWRFTSWDSSPSCYEPNTQPDGTGRWLSVHCRRDGALRWNDISTDLLPDPPHFYLPMGYVVEYSTDCNSDGIVDYGQIRAGELVDVNANNIPDCCEQSVSCSPCPGDIDESGTVNGVDLAAILAVWGSDGGKYPRADTNNDGVVNGADLATVLGSWGSCE